MSITNCKAKTPEEALERFEKAIRADEMRGMQDPEDRPGIQDEYEDAKAEMLWWIKYIP